jgi:2-polyprenyl-3-methyl-5-hydroxy-6-metoxy-1,4-benzoquinol methylase
MTKPGTQIKGALNLDGDPAHVKAYYEKWAVSYDRDVDSEAYTADKIMLDCCQRTPVHNSLRIDPRNLGLSIHDAGCGTGLVGEVFHAAGYRNISGSDLSGAMLGQARKRQIYSDLTSGVDLTQSVREQWKNAFDMVLCCGVFTSGHVPPDTLLRLFEMTVNGGLVIVSTRTAYYEEMHYQDISDSAIAQGKAALLLNLRDAPYTKDGNAHYWVYAVL